MLSTAVFLVALLALTNRLHGITDIHGLGAIAGVAVLATFLMLSLGVLFARADQGWSRESSRDDDGGMRLRQLLPIAVLGPVLLGAGILVFYRNIDLYSKDAIALYSILVVAAASGIVWWNGRWLNHADTQRAAAQQQFNDNLEAQVAARTAELKAANQALKAEIEKRQQSEARLNESRQELQQQLTEIETIYRSAPVGLNVLDTDLRFVRINERLAEMNGLPVAAHIGRTIRELLPDIADTAEQLLAPILETGEPLLNVEIQGETPAQPGIKRIWKENFLPLKDGERVIGISTVCEEITERRRAEQALADRAEQQAEVARIGQQALTIKNLDVLFAQVTARVADVLDVEYCEIFELMPATNELLLRSGMGWQKDLVGHARIKDDRTSQAGYTLSVKAPIVVEDLRTELRFDGSTLLTDRQVVSGMSTVINDVANRSFGVIGVHTCSQRHFTENDVNFLQAIASLLAAAVGREYMEHELRELNYTLEQRVHERTQALELSNKELEAFSYSVAHDLRAPLRAIQGFAQVLGEDYEAVLDDLGQEYLHRLATSAENLDVLIQDLLAYSRLGRAEIHRQSIDVMTVVNNILTELEPALKAKLAKVDVSPELPTVYAHSSIFKHILTNLISNALKFVAPDVPPHIRIWSEMCDRASTPRYVRIWVEDNGIGILPQHQARIFNPFERLHSVDTYAGTGIGLAIVARGIRRMHGQFGVESTLNQGSRFWIELEGK